MMNRKNVIRTLTAIAVVLLLGWSFFYFSDDTRGFKPVDTSVAIASPAEPGAAGRHVRTLLIASFAAGRRSGSRLKSSPFEQRIAVPEIVDGVTVRTPFGWGNRVLW